MIDPNNKQENENINENTEPTNEGKPPEQQEVNMKWDFTTNEQTESIVETESKVDRQVEAQQAELKNHGEVVVTRAQSTEPKPKRKWKGFLNLVAAGVVGSALTLTVAPFAEDLVTNNAVKQEENVPATPVTTQPTKVSTSSIADIVEQSSKAIVGITNIQKQQQNPFSQSQSQSVESGTGSGVIFQKNGNTAYIVTNNHVVEGANEIQVSLYNGEKVDAKLIGTDALTDLAVLKIDADHVEAVLEFGDSDVLRAGEQVLAIGNPLGLNLSRTVTQGIVSAVDRSISVSTSAGEWDLNVIQTDAAINPGNSGGALINTQGQVIGINSLKISSDNVEGLGFAIPSNDAVPIINEIIEKGHVERPYMGIGLASLQEIPQMYYSDLPKDVTEGVIVTSVQPGSSAEKAGLRIQDVIVKIDDIEVKSSMELRKYLYSNTNVGDEIKISFYRSGKLETTTLVLTGSVPQIN